MHIYRAIRNALHVRRAVKIVVKINSYGFKRVMNEFSDRRMEAVSRQWEDEFYPNLGLFCLVNCG